MNEDTDHFLYGMFSAHEKLERLRHGHIKRRVGGNTRAEG